MGYLVAIGLSTGIVAAVFCHLVFVAQVVNVIVWAAFVGEAIFFAAGGKNQGLFKGLASNFAGVFWAAVIFFISGNWKSPLSMGIAVFIAVVAMCVQAQWKVLSFIPGAFAGCASFFGSASAEYPAGNLIGVLIALTLGALMGWAAEKAAVWAYAKFISKPQSDAEKQSA